MASREADVLDALRVAIAGIDATGTYTNNLTGTDCVTVSSVVIENARVPRVHIMGGASRSSDAPALTDRSRQFEIDVVGVAQPTLQTAQQRAAAGYNLAADIRQKLEAVLLATALSGLVIDIQIETVGVDGQDVGFGEVGVCHVAIVAFWDATIGAGAS